MWGVALDSSKGKDFFQQVLSSNSKATLEEAIFRSEQAFRPANLEEHSQFWKEEILKDHPQRVRLLGWIRGVKIEELLKSFPTTEF